MIGAALDRLFGTLVQTPATAGAPASTSGPFLSAGLLSDRVERYLDAMDVPMIVAGPVAEHPCLIGAVTRLYAAAAVDAHSLL